MRGTTIDADRGTVAQATDGNGTAAGKSAG
jgi:hypothetical protein